MQEKKLNNVLLENSLMEHFAYISFILMIFFKAPYLTGKENLNSMLSYEKTPYLSCSFKFENFNYIFFITHIESFFIAL